MTVKRFPRDFPVPKVHGRSAEVNDVLGKTVERESAFPRLQYPLHPPYPTPHPPSPPPPSAASNYHNISAICNVNEALLSVFSDRLIIPFTWLLPGERFKGFPDRLKRVVCQNRLLVVFTSRACVLMMILSQFHFGFYFETECFLTEETNLGRL